MLSAELLKKIRALEIRTSHLVTESLAGDYQSTFRGRGMEFEEARVYTPGDDIRNIDWNITARTGVPHVKVFREERELTVMLLVDISASGEFGTGERTKNEVAAEVAAILAHAAIRKNDKVGLILFTDRIEVFMPPKKGRSHIWRVIQAILTQKPEGRGTRLAEALDYLNKVIHKRSVIFLISDFLDSQFDKGLAVSQQRHDLIGISIRDVREEQLPAVGFLELEDPETGEVAVIDSSSAEVRETFNREAKRRREQLEKLFRSLNIDHIDIETRGSTIDPILAFFRKRMKAIRR